MQLGMIGLGRMGGNIVRRLMRGGHQCVVYDTNAKSVEQLAGEGATGSRDMAHMVSQMPKPRAIWVMLPAGAITEATVTQLGEHVRRHILRRLRPAPSGSCCPRARSQKPQ